MDHPENHGLARTIWSGKYRDPLVQVQGNLVAKLAKETSYDNLS